MTFLSILDSTRMCLCGHVKALHRSQYSIDNQDPENEEKLIAAKTISTKDHECRTIGCLCVYFLNLDIPTTLKNETVRH